MNAVPVTSVCLSMCSAPQADLDEDLGRRDHRLEHELAVRFDLDGTGTMVAMEITADEGVPARVKEAARRQGLNVR